MPRAVEHKKIVVFSSLKQSCFRTKNLRHVSDHKFSIRKVCGICNYPGKTLALLLGKIAFYLMK